METLEQVITEAVNRAFREKMEKKETQIEEAPKEKKYVRKSREFGVLPPILVAVPRQLKN